MCQSLSIEHIWAFKEENLEITHEKGMISTDFLDVKLNLEANEPNDYPTQYPAYTNVKSNIWVIITPKAIILRFSWWHLYV